MTREEFEALVESALKKLPRPFREKLANIVVVVEDWADEETLREMEIRERLSLYSLSCINEKYRTFHGRQ